MPPQTPSDSTDPGDEQAPNAEATDTVMEAAEEIAQVSDGTDELTVSTPDYSDAPLFNQFETTAVDPPAPDETWLVPGQKALLERDNLQLRERSREDKAALQEWATAFGIHDGQKPGPVIMGVMKEMETLRERNAQMQTVLGIGPNDDIMEATKRRNGEQVLGDQIFDGLPAVGHLLLMTKIGKMAGMGQYSGSPDQINDQNGDVWHAYVEENVKDGETVRTIVIRHEPGSYAYNEAMARKLQLESQIAQPVRQIANARKGLGKTNESSDRHLVAALEDELSRALARKETLESELESVLPFTAPIKVQEWRFDPTAQSLKMQGRA